MGIVYYGNYPLYLEQGRTEWLRELGFSYRYMEAHGIQLPVTHLSINYKRPAKYDDLLTVTTTLRQLPTVKIEFLYEIHNEDGVLLATAETTLVFIDDATGKIQKAPVYLVDALKDDFES